MLWVQKSCEDILKNIIKEIPNICEEKKRYNYEKYNMFEFSK